MSFDAGSVKSTLGIDIGGYTQGILKAESIARIFPTTVQNFLASPMLGLVGIAKQAGQAIAGIFNDVNKSMDAIGDQAEQIGLTGKSLDQLGRAAEMSGSSMSAVADAIGFMNRNAGQAAAGNKEAAASFADLGIGMGEVAALDPEQLFLRVSDAIAQLPTHAQRSAAAMDIFGRGAGSLVPLLAKGSAGVRALIKDLYPLGDTFGEAAGKSVDAWDQAMNRLGFVWEDIKRLLAEPIRDALMPYLNDVLKWVSEHPDQIKQTIRDVAGGIVRATTAVLDVMKTLLPVVELLAENLGPVVFGAAALYAVKTIGGLVIAYNQLAASIRTANAAAAAQTFAPGGGVAGGGKGGGKGGGMSRGMMLGGTGAMAAAGAATQIAMGDDPAAAIGQGAGGWAGGAAGALGGKIGALGGPWGALIGGGIGFIGGSIAGSMGGRAVGDAAGEAIRGGGGEPADPAADERQQRINTLVEEMRREAAEREQATKSVSGLSRGMEELGRAMARVVQDSADVMLHPQAESVVHRPRGGARDEAAAELARAASVTIDGIDINVDPKATAEEIIRQLRSPLTRGLQRVQEQIDGLAFAGRVYDSMA